MDTLFLLKLISVLLMIGGIASIIIKVEICREDLAELIIPSLMVVCGFLIMGLV